MLYGVTFGDFHRAQVFIIFQEQIITIGNHGPYEWLQMVCMKIYICLIYHDKLQFHLCCVCDLLQNTSNIITEAVPTYKIHSYPHNNWTVYSKELENITPGDRALHFYILIAMLAGPVTDTVIK